MTLLLTSVCTGSVFLYCLCFTSGLNPLKRCVCVDCALTNIHSSTSCSFSYELLFIPAARYKRHRNTPTKTWMAECIHLLVAVWLLSFGQHVRKVSRNSVVFNEKKHKILFEIINVWCSGKIDRAVGFLRQDTECEWFWPPVYPNVGWQGF